MTVDGHGLCDLRQTRPIAISGDLLSVSMFPSNVQPSGDLFTNHTDLRSAIHHHRKFVPVYVSENSWRGTDVAEFGVSDTIFHTGESRTVSDYDFLLCGWSAGSNCSVFGNWYRFSLWSELKCIFACLPLLTGYDSVIESAASEDFIVSSIQVRRLLSRHLRTLWGLWSVVFHMVRLGWLRTEWYRFPDSSRFLLTFTHPVLQDLFLHMCLLVIIPGHLGHPFPSLMYKEISCLCAHD